MKDKAGNILDSKEYLKRWGAGIKAITPYQQAKITYQNTYIILFGLAAGVAFTITSFNSFWWLSLILVAAFVNTAVSQLSNWQKYKLLKSLEDNEKEEQHEQQSSIRRD